MSDNLSPSLTAVLLERLLQAVQSKTVWAAIATFIIDIAKEAGHKVDPFWADSLPNILLNVGTGLGTLAIILFHLRSKKAISVAIATPTSGISP